MSRQSTSKGAIPKQKPATKQQKGKPGKDKNVKKSDKKDVVEWDLPPFSIVPKKKPAFNFEKLKKEMARRQAPQGEDIKEIRKILKEVKNIDLPVHEFINMIGPYTSDGGQAMRTVMAEDLEGFRKLAKKVYETMTQDVSDVLVNEQLQMVGYYEEKNTQLSDKMMRAINEIYEMAPNFEFEKFLKNREEYLKILFPLPRQAEMMKDNELCEMMKRQQAYHRLQWLRSEGERMAEENKRLMRRFEELKKEQKEEQERAAQLAAEAEAKRQKLAMEEIEMKEKLDELNESVEKSFIRDEMKTTKEHNKTASEISETSLAIAKGVKKSKPAVKKKRPEWSTVTAAQIEEELFETNVAATTKKAVSRTAIKRPKGGRRQPHFSPIKTPPQKEAPKQTSPFHYSPPKSPTEDVGSTKKPPSPFHYSPPKYAPPEQETRIEETTTTVQKRRPPVARQSYGPKDTWGGFY